MTIILLLIYVPFFKGKYLNQNIPLPVWLDQLFSPSSPREVNSNWSCFLDHQIHNHSLPFCPCNHHRACFLIIIRKVGWPRHHPFFPLFRYHISSLTVPPFSDSPSSLSIHFVSLFSVSFSAEIFVCVELVLTGLAWIAWIDYEWI